MIVAMSGCYDLLHDGHRNILRKGMELAGTSGTLYLLINTDESVKRLKGDNRPVQDLKTRIEKLNTFFYNTISASNGRLSCHTNITPFNTEQDLLQSYEIIKPDRILHGSDFEDINKVTGYKRWPILLVPKLKNSKGNVISTTMQVEANNEQADS